MSAHVQSMASSCPNTRQVLGGYSLGAAAADVVIAMNQPGFGFTNPLPPAADQHVAAVVLFGNATQKVVGAVPGPGPGFAGKVIDLCAGTDLTAISSVDELMTQDYQSLVRRSRVINVRACNSLSGG